MAQIKLTKKYRIYWSSDKILPEGYSEPNKLSTVTYINDKFWNWFESNSIEELDNKIDSENLKIKEKE